MNRLAFITACAGMLLLGGCTGWPWRQSMELTVASYNIRCPGDPSPNSWEERRADVVKMIRRINPDVFGLQEAVAKYTDYLTAEMPEYTFEGGCRDDGKRKGEASPVFFRKDRFECLKKGTFWLSETPDVPGSTSWHTACTRVCSWVYLQEKATGRAFVFCNTHTDHVSALARKNGMLLIIERMKEFCPEGTPIVFTGDHNCRENEEPAEAVAKILDNALYLSETPPQGSWRTFNGWGWREKEYSAVAALKLPVTLRNARKGSPDAEKDADGYKWEDCGPRIDYIYVSPGTRVKTYATHNDARPGLHTYPSDHFPVSAEIEL